MAKPSRETLSYFPFLMNKTWPPPQFMRLGLELNQHGHAALQVQASSRSPLILHLAPCSVGSAAETVARMNKLEANAVQNVQKRRCVRIRFLKFVFVAVCETVTSAGGISKRDDELPASAIR